MHGPRPAAILLDALLSLVLVGCAGAGSRPSARTSPSASSSAPGTSSSATPSSATPSPATPSPANSSPTVSGPEAAVDAALARLDARGRLAQLFVVGVPLSNLASGDALVEQGLGGVFLAGRSTIAASDLGAVTGRWAAEAPGPRPWVATDMEGGQVQTLSGPGLGRLPTAVDQGRLPAGQLAGLVDGLGAGLHTAGVTLDLAPVADVVPAGTERSNAPIGFFDRQYGSTAPAVLAAAGTVVHGLAAHQVSSAVKHFPGLGRVTANTDTVAGVTDSGTSADDDSVSVFGTLGSDPAAPMVMVSLATYTRIDGSQPAAFSPTVITGLLRQRLGFAGPVISDDLGIARSATVLPPGERAVRFLAAGGTLVLTVAPDTLQPMIDAVSARVGADPVFAAQVDRAVRTALLAKARAGLLGS